MRQTAQGRQQVCINRIVTDSQEFVIIYHASKFYISLLLGELVVMSRYGVGGGGRPSVAFGDGQVIKRSSLFTSIALRINARESILKVVIDAQGESESG